jgi:uncharacterized protein YggE
MHAFRRFAALPLAALFAASAAAQTSGNIAYGNSSSLTRAEQAERQQRILSKEDLPPDNSMFVDAAVLMNVKAEEYVATFAIAREGATVDEAASKMSDTLKHFTNALKALHIRDADIAIDFITEPKIYSYDINGNVAKEHLSGFELKKNVSVHYTDPEMLDKLNAAAATSDIFDLVKVDYIVRDTNAVQAKVMAEAAGVIQQKLARDEKLLGIRVKSTPAIYAERADIHYPSAMYDGYTPAEAESLSRPSNLDRFTIQRVRKGSTFYYNALKGEGFDKVINPVVLEPVVQFTLYLKVKYELVH